MVVLGEWRWNAGYHWSMAQAKMSCADATFNCGSVVMVLCVCFYICVFGAIIGKISEHSEGWLPKKRTSNGVNRFRDAEDAYWT